MLKITNDKLNNFFENNTIITVKEAEKIGIKRQILSNLCKKGILERVKKEIFESGKIETLSKMGAKIYIYDKERTICDIIKNKEKIDVDVFSKALKLFFKDKDIKVRKLIKYSKELKIEKKVREYLEVLIWHQKS